MEVIECTGFNGGGFVTWKFWVLIRENKYILTIAPVSVTTSFPPDYDPSDDEFDDTLEGDQDAADEIMEEIESSFEFI